MPLRLNDFRCDDCSTVTEHLFNTEKVDELECSNCKSKNLTKLIGATHHSSDGGKGIAARTPDGFKDVLKAIKSGVPKTYLGDRFNTI